MESSQVRSPDAVGSDTSHRQARLRRRSTSRPPDGERNRARFVNPPVVRCSNRAPGGSGWSGANGSEASICDVRSAVSECPDELSISTAAPSRKCHTGILNASCPNALKHWVERLADDHVLAESVAKRIRPTSMPMPATRCAPRWRVTWNSTVFGSQGRAGLAQRGNDGPPHQQVADACGRLQTQPLQADRFLR